MTATAPIGDCVVTRFGDEIRVDRADPRVLVTMEVLRTAARNPQGSPIDLVGDVLTIRGTNRTVVYRVGEYIADIDCHVAEWPD